MHFFCTTYHATYDIYLALLMSIMTTNINIYTKSWFNISRGSWLSLVLNIWSNRLAARSMPWTTLGSLQRCIMTSGAGYPLHNNPTLNYTKLTQKCHNQKQYHDVQCCTWAWGLWFLVQLLALIHAACADF